MKPQLYMHIGFLALGISSCRHLGIEKRKYLAGYHIQMSSSRHSLDESVAKLQDNRSALGFKKVKPLLSIDERTFSDKALYPLADTSGLRKRLAPVLYQKKSSPEEIRAIRGGSPVTPSKKHTEAQPSHAHGKWKNILILAIGFLIIVGVEILLPKSIPSILSILVAVAVLVLLILLYNYLQKKKSSVEKRPETDAK